MTDRQTSTLIRKKPVPRTGIVHLGLGVFFRAHAAVYIKEAMARFGGDWGVVGVSLCSSRVRDQLAPQDFLYSAVALSDQKSEAQVVDVVTDVLVAPENPQAVLDVMVPAVTKIVSLTVTEKGYCRVGANGGLDLEHPDIHHDLTNASPRSAVGFIVRALQARRDNGLSPFTVMSLDNLPANGRLTRQVVCEFAEQLDASLAGWIEDKGCFPSTMVDRIVPKTTPAAVSRLHDETGVLDLAAVFHEPFRQWVIEDHFVDNMRPELEAVGAQFVLDVEPFEHMKLRMLNGTHSAIAYIGILKGHTTVFEAVSDTDLSVFLDEMWWEEIIPSLQPPVGVDLHQYAKALQARLANPGIRHLLDQIAMDGTQKLPQRILEPLFENMSAGRSFEKFLIVVAAWIRFLQQRVAQGNLNDPMADILEAVVLESAQDRELVSEVLAIKSIFGAYPVDQISDTLLEALAALERTHSFKGIPK